jgi:hypothetical protein
VDLDRVTGAVVPDLVTATEAMEDGGPVRRQEVYVCPPDCGRIT